MARKRYGAADKGHEERNALCVRPNIPLLSHHKSTSDCAKMVLKAAERIRGKVSGDLYVKALGKREGWDFVRRARRKEQYHMPRN